MRYRRMPIEVESPEQLGYSTIRYNLAESSVADVPFSDLNLDLDALVLAYGDHLGHPGLRALLASEAPPLQPDHVLLTVGAAFRTGVRRSPPIPGGIRPRPSGRTLHP